MCGRFARSRYDHPWLENLDPDVWPPRWNQAPGTPALVFGCNAQGEPAPASLFWGFQPRWMKDGKAQINARSERVAQAPMFRQAFAAKRCVIPADGFYEWHNGPGGKQPHFIRQRDNRPLFMAGIWARLPEPRAGVDHGFAILTTAAGPDIVGLHHRQPVLLDDDQLLPWLDVQTPAEQLLACCRPSPPNKLESWPVSKAVNQASKDGPELVEAIQQ